MMEQGWIYMNARLDKSYNYLKINSNLILSSTMFSCWKVFAGWLIDFSSILPLIATFSGCSYSYWAMMTIMPTPVNKARTSKMDCFHLTLTKSSEIDKKIDLQLTYHVCIYTFNHPLLTRKTWAFIRTITPAFICL